MLRRILSVFAVLALFLCQHVQAFAQTAPLATLIFSANSWGYLKPCPS